MEPLVNYLCRIQGRLFELSVDQGYDSEHFIKTYMNSNCGKRFNSSFDSLQWLGERYILEELAETEKLKHGKTYSKDIMFWIGYLYCYWHFKTNEESKEIVKVAPPKTMFQTYFGLHTVGLDYAIDDLKDLYEERENKGRKLKLDYLFEEKNISYNTEDDNNKK